MGASTVTAKGQITIPAKIRDEFGIESGDEIVFMKGLDGQLKVHVSHRRAGAGRGVLRYDGHVDMSRSAIGDAVASGVASRLKRSAVRRRPKPK
jgi:antitoxin PrlF